MKRVLLLALLAGSYGFAAETTEAEKQGDQDEQITQETLTQEASLPQKIDTEPLELMETEKKAVAMVNSVIKGNQLFNVKIANPLLPAKMQLWQQRGLVRYPTKQTPWVTFKKDIEKFGSDLHLLLAKDPQLNSYYHIETLRKNHALYKSLEGLQKNLEKYEPKIEFAQPFKLDKKSLESLQKLINIYGTKFYQENLLAQIAAVLKSFETKTKETQDKEQKPSGRDSSSLFEFDDSSFNFDENTQDFDFDLESLGFDDDFLASFFD